jgi:hypothetical protein
LDYQFIGLDSELINLIYFESEIERRKYLEDVKSLLLELNIQPGTERLVAIDSIADSATDLPFIRDILAFSGNFQYSKNTDRNNFYINCQLCEHNILTKLEANNADLGNEEGLLEKIMSSDLNGYAKLSVLFRFGEAFATLSNKEKRNFYFNLLRGTNFDISPVTVADFYKLVAEIYVASDEKNEALSWYKAGLTLNPKLSVKKAMKALEA